MKKRKRELIWRLKKRECNNVADHITNLISQKQVKQKDYEYERLEAYRANPETEKLDYEAEGMKVVDLITQKYIENSEFNATNYYKELEEIFI